MGILHHQIFLYRRFNFSASTNVQDSGSIVQLFTKGMSMEPQGLYDPAHEHDACGVGFVVDIKGKK